jgi:predicted enzyme related to lactoylglutathione lyase
MVRVRYIVNNVEEAITFYTSNFGFDLEQDFSPNMAILKLGELTLWLAGHKASAAKPMSDGSVPCAGGWSRFVLAFDDLEAVVSKLEDDGVKFKNDIVEGPGGKQILCQDPSGNVVELFQPARVGL